MLKKNYEEIHSDPEENTQSCTEKKHKVIFIINLYHLQLLNKSG